MEKLSLSTLPEFDGGSLQVLVDQAIRDVYLDLEDRPTLGAARNVNINITFKPTAEGSDLEEVTTEITVQCKLPHKATRENILAPSKKLGGLVFDPGSRRAKCDPDQLDIPFEEENA